MDKKRVALAICALLVFSFFYFSGPSGETTHSVAVAVEAAHGDAHSAPAAVEEEVVVEEVVLYAEAPNANATMANFEQLEVAMNYTDVVEILGEADVCASPAGITTCSWGTEDEHIQVLFVNNWAVVLDSANLK